MKLVSICIPAFENGNGIKRLLESIQRQTYDPIEIIITDDSASQEVETLAASFAGRIPVRYIQNSRRLGATANWNKAVSMAEPESGYIKLMHHDDWFTFPDSLEKMVMMLEENGDCFMAFCGSRQVTESGEAHDRYTAAEDVQAFRTDYRTLFSIGNTIGAPSAVLIRNGERLPVYDESLKWIVDMDYYMALLKEHPHFVYTEEPLVSIGISEKQLTNSCVDDADLMMREYSYVYQKYGLSDEASRKKMAYYVVRNNGSFKQAEAMGIPPEYIKHEIRKKRRAQWDSYIYAIKRRIR